MFMQVATALLAAATLATHTDTTVSVRRGARLILANFGGDITVQSWNRDAIRIEAEHPDHTWVRVVTTGPDVEVRADTRRHMPAVIDYNIAVPTWMPLVLSGVHSDISVTGTRSDVSAETVNGEVNVEGGDGYLKLGSVQGQVAVVGARGRLELHSVNDEVRIKNVEGTISADAVNGDIILDGVRSDLVEASTVNGTLIFMGDLRARARYALSTHNGDLMIGVPDRANATVSVATFSGDFESAFPVQLERTRRGKRFRFTLGSGSAMVDLESFGGTIQLLRAKELEVRRATQVLREQEQKQRIEKRKVRRKIREIEIRHDEDDNDR